MKSIEVEFENSWDFYRTQVIQSTSIMFQKHLVLEPLSDNDYCLQLRYYEKECQKKAREQIEQKELA